MNKHFQTTGIVIRKTELNESDRIITVLTPDIGKIDCIAKGARRISSKFCGRLELFNEIKINCFQGRELATLNETELITCFADTQDLNKHRVLFYMAEISNRLIQQNQQIEGIYQLIRDTLENIGNSEKTEILLHSYLIKLLTSIGFLPQWNRCSVCGDKLDISSTIRLNGNSNPACQKCFCQSDRLIEPSSVKWVNFMQNYGLSDILKVSPGERESGFVWIWLKETLDGLLSSPLKSEEFLVQS